MVHFASTIVLVAAASAALVSAAPMPTGAWPASKGTVKYSAPYVVKAGTTFDGGMKTYERSNVQCKAQTEGGSKDAVFLVEPGATLKNVIIGKNQMEGVHCDKHDCTIQNVWWTDVCEDALSIKGGSASSVSKVIGGGARYASDKVIQQNGPGTVSIDGFYAQDFGKLYRSCGTCGSIKRKVTISNVLAVDPKVSVVTVNKNNNDEAKLTNVHVKSSNKKIPICQWSQAAKSPKNLGSGPSGTLCQYSTSNVKFV
uniref:Probable pectate lyase F n=1 Tax=Globisporangium ultimum (strain ATCC 200006 / CBS 805.95 / DAOM BR144) TaxID=431595 RepID=K3WC50_GLOUD